MLNLTLVIDLVGDGCGQDGHFGYLFVMANAVQAYIGEALDRHIHGQLDDMIEVKDYIDQLECFGFEGVSTRSVDSGMPRPHNYYIILTKDCD